MTTRPIQGLHLAFKNHLIIDARIDYPEVRHAWMDQNMSSSGGGRGIVAKVDVKGENATVTFKKEFENGSVT